MSVRDGNRSGNYSQANRCQFEQKYKIEWDLVPAVSPAFLALQVGVFRRPLEFPNAVG